jgi:hypothetical protein
MIITCRPGILSPSEIPEFFSIEKKSPQKIKILHLLPFKADQLMAFVSGSLGLDPNSEKIFTEKLMNDSQIRRVLRNPFVLTIFLKSWDSISKKNLSFITKFLIYDGFIENWISSNLSLLPPGVVKLITSEGNSLITEFQKYSATIAISAFSKKKIRISKKKADSFDFVWTRLRKLVAEESEKIFKERQAALTTEKKR